MPMGASPAKCLGDFRKAGRTAVLNSSQGEDHSTSTRGGSGHWSTLCGMVSTVLMQPRYREDAPSGYPPGRRARYGNRELCQSEVPAPTWRELGSPPSARASALLQCE